LIQTYVFSNDLVFAVDTSLMMVAQKQSLDEDDLLFCYGNGHFC